MKKNLLSFLLMALIFAGCSSDSDNNTNPAAEAQCGNASAFTVAQNQGQISVAITASSTPLYYEISVLVAGISDNNPEFGNMQTIDDTQENFEISDLYMIPGETYLVYLRSVCADGSKSDWSQPKVLTVSDYCGAPRNLVVSPDFDGPNVTWEGNGDNNSYYQLSYGPQGFELGSSAGTTYSVNGTSYNGMPVAANTTYDFYVRSYCNATLGWSTWTGPYTYLSTANSNLCLAPTNVTYTVESSSAVNFQWSYNGESSFEVALVGGSQTIEDVTIYPWGTGNTPTFTGLSSSATYTFYVRAKCANGGFTAWTTKLVDY